MLLDIKILPIKIFINNIRIFIIRIWFFISKIYIIIIKNLFFIKKINLVILKAKLFAYEKLHLLLKNLIKAGNEPVKKQENIE